jgi:hypothetical protein
MAEKGKTLRPEIRLMNQVGIDFFFSCFLPLKFSHGFWLGYLSFSIVPETIFHPTIVTMKSGG